MTLKPALALTRGGSSSNIDYYKSNWGLRLYVEVLIDSFTRDSETRRLIKRKIPEYHIMIMQHNGKKWTDTRFTYAPSRRPPNLHLSNRTVTRLVREKLGV